MTINATLRGLACALLFAVAGAADARGGDGGPPPQEALVEWAATDFATHGPRPEALRNVHLRQDAEGVYRNMLCGEFRAAGGGDWMAFATIRTDPYEHWIGGLAASICARATPSPAGDDLSAVLQARLGALADPAPQP